MKAVLPGRPESRLQALATGYWDSCRVTVYITGSAFCILGDADTIIQTIYDDDEQALEAVALDEATGKIAVCTRDTVRIYKPFGKDEGALRWALQSSFTVEREVPIGTGEEEEDSTQLPPICLSWGSSEELLVAHSCLELYQTSILTECSWRKQLANPAHLASLSYDSAYVASVGQYDRLVKVWRRLSYGSDDVRFDFLYLPHPRVVTGIQWRRPRHIGQTIENVLYTFCADNHLRIWAGSDSHGQQHLQLWGKVDLAASIQTRTLQNSSMPTIRWAFIMHGRDLSAATEKVVQDTVHPAEEDKPALDHLIEVAKRSPEICVVLDGRGHMSAWALENVGSKTPKSSIFNVTHVTSSEFDFLKGTSPSNPEQLHVEAYSYCNTGGHLHVLLHFFDGRIVVYRSGNVASLFDLNPKRTSRLSLQCLWTGHSAPIRKIVRNFSGRAIVSRTEQNQCIVWTHELDYPRDDAARLTTLRRQAVIQHDKQIHRTCVLRKGRFVVFLHHDTIALWDCRSSLKAVLVAEIPYEGVPGKPLCLLILPRHRAEDYTTAHIATVTSEKQGVVWEVKLPFYKPNERIVAPGTAVNGSSQQPNGHHDSGSIKEFFRFQLPEDVGDLAYVLPVDPAGAPPTISGFLDVFARDVAISYTHSGRVEFWTARVTKDDDEKKQKVEWLSTSSMETGLSKPALVSGSMNKKAALVNSTRSLLTIWDIRGARLEYAQDFASELPNANGGTGGGGHGVTIRDLDWTSTPDSQSILAVGFPHRVLLLSQMRFDYLNQGPAWAAVREISLRELTPHPIGDSTWLGDGHLVVGAGNQLFIEDRRFDVESGDMITMSLRLPTPTRKRPGKNRKEKGKWDLFDVVQRLNGPLPVFHPQFLSQCMLSGKIGLVHRILVALHKTLKFWVEGESVDDYLGIGMEEFYIGDLANKTSSRKEGGKEYFASGRRMSYDDGEEAFSEETATDICERLTRIGLPQLSGHEQIQLVDIVECVGLVEKQRRSLDENGARFMLFYRQHALRNRRRHGTSNSNEGDETSTPLTSWREISWAYHSESQDILLDFVTKQHGGGGRGPMLWADARESGVFMWLTDNNAVRAQFEAIARNEYTKGDDLKNPVDCSLFYLALKKKTVLQGLWRMASWNREQGATMRFLANNFDDPKWKTAALKNAYALMSKRRFAYAAAFFLLADALGDAVNVCLNQLKDLQLAIAIARVYEGGDKPGPVLRKLLEEEVLTIAAQEGNRWLASWAFWMLHRRDMAVRALITPVFTLLETPGLGAGGSSSPGSADLRSKLFLTDDPALIILYSQLRQKTLQTLRGASKVTPKVEWQFVLHNAGLYDRMGCDLLGLDLVRNWEFLQLPTASTVAGMTGSAAVSSRLGLGGDIIDPLKLLRRRSSLVVADLPPHELPGGLASAPVSPLTQKRFPSEMKTGLGGPPGGGGGGGAGGSGNVPAPKPPPTVFEEPDANSLLDSFGF